MILTVEPSGQGCGATLSGVDLSASLDAQRIGEIREAWLTHKVLVFTGQHMDDDALERFTIAMGGFGEDPFFEPIEGRTHIAAIVREADEQTPLFAEVWHSDWSFLPTPPSGTCLMAVDIPPHGGDTLFADQAAAFAALPEDRKEYLRGLTAIHSAYRGYAPDGLYGKGDVGRSMTIRASADAYRKQSHPLIRTHPETGEETIFCNPGYVIGIENMDDSEAMSLIMELTEWQTSEPFLYRHRWEQGMVVLWDNRAVVHKATGGYEGYRRELHRTTISGQPAP